MKAEDLQAKKQSYHNIKQYDFARVQGAWCLTRVYGDTEQQSQGFPTDYQGWESQEIATQWCAGTPKRGST